MPYIWEDDRLKNAIITLDKFTFIENRNQFTLVNLTQETFQKVMNSLHNSSKIRERDLTINLKGQFTDNDIYSIQYVLTLHIF